MKKMRDFAICTVGWSTFFLIFITTVIKVEFYSRLHNCHLSIEDPFSYGIISDFCLDLSEFCKLKKKMIFFLEAREMASYSFFGSFVEVFCFFGFLFSEKESLSGQLSHFPLLRSWTQCLDKHLVKPCVLWGLFRIALPRRHTSPKTEGLRPDSPLAEWMTPRHRGTSRAPRREGLRTVFRMCVCGRKETKQSSYLASL